MNTISGVYYSVASPKNTSQLADTYDTLEEAKEAAEQSRQRQIDSGYKPDKYIITETKWFRMLDDKDNFVEEIRTTRKV